MNPRKITGSTALTTPSSRGSDASFTTVSRRTGRRRRSRARARGMARAGRVLHVFSKKYSPIATVKGSKARGGDMGARLFAGSAGRA